MALYISSPSRVRWWISWPASLGAHLDTCIPAHARDPPRPRSTPVGLHVPKVKIGHDIDEDLERLTRLREV
jgi:hypothetical protein